MSKDPKDDKKAPATPAAPDPSAAASPEVARLQALLAAKDKELAETRAALAAGNAVKPGRSRLDTRQRHDAKRMKLMQETHRENGQAYYLIPEGAEPYYRQGKLHQPGSVVTIPEDEIPSYTWESVQKEVPKPQFVARGGDGEGAARPQDRTL